MLFSTFIVSYAKKKKKSLNDRLKEVIEAVNIINATFYLFF